MSITTKYRACRPHILRERGLIAVLEGNEDRARRSFDESLQIADSNDARYDHAQTLLARGNAGLRFGWPDAQQQVDSGTEITTRIAEFDD